MEEFAEVFWDELGVLRGIEATVAVNESAIPRFHKARSVPFTLKEKVKDNYSSKCGKENWYQWIEAIGQHQLSWLIRRMGVSSGWHSSLTFICLYALAKSSLV